jgi:hypothetical protein
MGRYHVCRALREGRLSSFEEHSFVAGMLLLLVGTVVPAAHGDAGGLAGALGAMGLGTLGPSALASALLKLDDESGLTPRADLRQTEVRAGGVGRYG